MKMDPLTDCTCYLYKIPVYISAKWGKKSVWINIQPGVDYKDQGSRQTFFHHHSGTVITNKFNHPEKTLNCTEMNLFFSLNL